MADETYAGLNIWDIYAGGNPELDWAQPAEAVKPGDAIRIGTDGKIYWAKNTDLVVSGIVAKMPDQDIDTAYSTTTDKLIPYFKKGNKTKVYVKLASASPLLPVVKGSLLALSGTDGQLKEHAYTNASEATDLGTNVIGSSLEYDASHLSDMHIIKAFI